jgi:PAS domain S-box-containing protein
VLLAGGTAITLLLFDLVRTLLGTRAGAQRIADRLTDKLDGQVLQASEEKYRTVADFTYDWELWISPDRMLLYCSPSCQRITGYSAEEFIKNPGLIISITHPEDRERVERHISSVAPITTSMDEFEFRIITRGGAIRWIGHICHDVYGKDGVYLGKRISNRDITERNVAEQKLRQASTYNRSLIEASLDPMLTIGADGRITDVNRAMEDIVGILREDLIGSDFSDYFMDREKACAVYQQVFKDGAVRDSPLEIWHRDGHLIPVLYHASVYKDDSGDVAGVVAVARDITERKKLEDAMRDSEARFRNLLQDVQHIAVQGYGPGGTTHYWNKASEQLYGYSEQEAIGRNLLDLIIPPEMRAEVEQAIRQMAETGQPIPAAELSLQRKDGSRVAVFSCHAIVKVPGQETEQFCLDIDLTERSMMEEELKIAKERAESANRAKSEFLANMSHEIRSPMSGVIGTSQLLKMTALTTEQREYVDILTLSGRNLLSLINDILDLSKIEACRIELEAIDFDLQEVMLDTVKTLLSRAQEKGVELVARIDPDVPLLVRGDAERLRQILANLIGNAIKFTEKGSVTVSIRKDCEAGGCVTLRFMIRDTGIGIAADKLGMIFEPFTQADGSTTRTYGGTGLGLTISRQLAELMGGSVGVESVKGEGSTFWFTAVLEKQGETLLPLPHPSSPAGMRFSGENIRLLLADDEPTSRMVMKAILTKLGCLVDVVKNGSETITALENNDYDLVLMDCMMPVMDGYEATAVIRDQNSNVRNHAIPVIALTARAFKEDRELCRAAGMDDYLSKPADVADLRAVLEKWMQFDAAHFIDRDTGAGLDAVSCVPANDVFDRASFIRRNQGNSELSREVATMFIDTAPEYIESIRNAVAAQDAALLLQSSHKLRGAAANVSLPLLTEIAGMLESIAESGNIEKAGQLLLLPELEFKFEQAVKALREMLVSQKG